MSWHWQNTMLNVCRMFILFSGTCGILTWTGNMQRIKQNTQYTWNQWNHTNYAFGYYRIQLKVRSQHREGSTTQSTFDLFSQCSLREAPEEEESRVGPVYIQSAPELEPDVLFEAQIHVSPIASVFSDGFEVREALSLSFYDHSYILTT